MARIWRFPYHVTIFEWIKTFALFGYWEYACGGTIIDELWIVTAAHCLIRNKRTTQSDEMKVGVGKDWAVYPNQFAVARVIPHPRYRPRGFYDIGLVKLANKLTFSRKVQKVQLHSNSSENLVGRKIWFAGFGKTKKNSGKQFQLMYGQFEILYPLRCQEMFGAKYTEDFALCLNSLTFPGPDPCGGDSGGGHVIRVPKEGKGCGIDYLLVGVESLGGYCGDGIVDIATRVSFFKPWITAQIAENG